MDETRQIERRTSVSPKEFELLKEILSNRLTAHETLDTQRFEAMEKVSTERHEHVRLRLEAVGKNVHDLRGQLTEVFALPGRMNELVGEMKDVPRNKDLEHVSQTVNTRFDNFESARKQETVRNRWIIGLIVTVGVPLGLALLKKMGWL